MFPLLLLLLLLQAHFSLLPAQPDPLPIQPFNFPTSPPSTIPAFPEQSDVAGSCPLDLPDDLFKGISRACSATRLSRSRCCPTLAAWIYSAYSATALASRSVRYPASADLPVLPDNSEACVYGVEKALEEKGVVLGRVNETCDVAYCYCGVRLRPLTCPGGLTVEEENGKWITKDNRTRRIERECAMPGLAGCSRCLRSLYQLKRVEERGVNASRSKADGRNTGGGGEFHDRDCQLMGLTWLLAKNRTLYLPTVSHVLRAFMLSPDGVDPLSCTLARDGLPLAVDSADFDDASSATTGAHVHLPLIYFVLLLLVLRSPVSFFL